MNLDQWWDLFNICKNKGCPSFTIYMCHLDYAIVYHEAYMHFGDSSLKFLHMYADVKAGLPQGSVEVEFV